MMNEQVSAMVDGEVTPSQVEDIVVQMKRDPDVIGQWERYHLISDVLSNNTPSHIDNNFADRIMDRLSVEAEIVSFPQSSKTRLQSVAKQLVGLSVAASVAVIALLTYENLIQSGTDSTLPSVAVVSDQKEVEKPVALVRQSTPIEGASPVLDQRINNYLVNHSEYAISNGMRGMPPYMRMVSQEKP